MYRLSLCNRTVWKYEIVENVFSSDEFWLYSQTENYFRKRKKEKNAQIFAIMHLKNYYGHFCHDRHFCHNDYNSTILVSIEAYWLQESSPGFQNHIKYFCQRKKGKKLTEHIFPLEKRFYPLNNRWLEQDRFTWKQPSLFHKFPSIWPI